MEPSGVEIRKAKPTFTHQPQAHNRTANAYSTRVARTPRTRLAWRRLGGRTGGHPRPTHRVNQKSRSGRTRRHAGTTTSANGRPSREAVVASPVAPRGPLAFRLALRRTRGPLTSFPLARVAAPSSMRGSGATHTGADVRKRKSKHDSRHTGRLDCRFTTHLVDRHKTACRITHALNK